MHTTRVSEFKKRVNPVWVLCLFLLSLLHVQCTGQQARRPINARSTSFYKISAQRNKLIFEEENKLIKKYIEKDSDRTYLKSEEGFYYAYITSEPEVLPKPKEGDELHITYNVKKINDEIIYTESEIGTLRIIYGKDQDLFVGLRRALSLMKSGEKITAFFPSALAYGYHGDEKKIGVGTPLKCDIELKKIVFDSNLNN